MKAWDEFWGELTKEEQDVHRVAVANLDRVLTLARRVNQLESAITLFLERPGCNPTQRRLAFRRLAWSLNDDEQPTTETPTP